MVPALNSCFLVGKISQIAVLSIAGLVTMSLIVETAPLALAAVVALIFGQRLREKIAIEVYRRILQILLGVLAMVLTVQFFS